MKVNVHKLYTKKKKEGKNGGQGREIVVLVVVSAFGFLISGRFRDTGKPYRTHGDETTILKASTKTNQAKKGRSQYHIPVCNPILATSPNCKSRTTTLLSPQKCVPNNKHTQRAAVAVNVANTAGSTTTVSICLLKAESSSLMEVKILRSASRVWTAAATAFGVSATFAAVMLCAMSIPSRSATTAVRRTAVYEEGRDSGRFGCCESLEDMLLYRQRHSKDLIRWGWSGGVNPMPTFYHRDLFALL